ncbi:hypothetical protein ZIOFF_065221 [Zingiber officinale]|uniref:Uncharacterized protein n=1 Tax=Zingiber officinale TaxID=94328 RepID=A0A8J5EX25_ZINOF|nr:hypothetical protein ZIOFF_065221 [Zingiber officinale]
MCHTFLRRCFLSSPEISSNVQLYQQSANTGLSPLGVHTELLGTDVAEGNLAGIYYEQSQLNMAILHYKQAINCDSTFIEAYNNLGNALKDAGHALKDVGHYRSSFALQPNHPQALSSLGNIYMDCNMMSVAASFYKATLAVATGISAPFNNLAIIYKQQTAADGLVNKGNTFKEIGRVTEAIQDYIRAVNIRPTMPEAHANLASAYKDSYIHSGHGLYAVLSAAALMSGSMRMTVSLCVIFPELTNNLLLPIARGGFAGDQIPAVPVVVEETEPLAL